MKALTLHQPWASLLVLGYKPDDTRNWRSNSYRGPLAIHAGTAVTDEAVATYENADIRAFLDAAGLPNFDALPRGCFVGYCHLVDIVPTESVQEQRTPAQLATGDYGPNRFAWLMDHPATMPEVECEGSQRLWSVPEELLHHFKLQAY
jgi:hypothetical protein